jgi:aminoglycoside 6'-N-acetyltransferase
VTSVRRAGDDDVDLLVAWHADPEVSRYWDDETFTREEMRARLREERVDAWIVEADGRPVGYLQSWWEPGEPRRGGLDGFLVPEARGRGLMPDAARNLASSLLAEGWREVTVDPYAWNERALRAWAKAGFVEVSRHDPDDEHLHPWVLMRFTG